MLRGNCSALKTNRHLAIEDALTRMQTIHEIILFILVLSILLQNEHCDRPN